MSRFAIVHPTTLLGKELLERLASRPALAASFTLLSSDEEEIGTLLDAGGETTFVARADDDALESVEVAIFAGDRPGPATIAFPDSCAAVFAHSEQAPQESLAAIAGFAAEARLGAHRLVGAHAASIGLARLLAPLRAHGLKSAHATAIVPVSEHGAAGIDILFDETRTVLTFAERKKNRLFPAQIAFNLLPSDELEATIEAEVRTALGASAATLSVGCAQGGLFHGVALSLAVELDGKQSADELRKLLAAAPGIEKSSEPKRLGTVASAGEADVQLGAVRKVGSGRYRIWAVLDNLALEATNLLDLADELLTVGRPS